METGARRGGVKTGVAAGGPKEPVWSLHPGAVARQQRTTRKSAHRGLKRLERRNPQVRRRERGVTVFERHSYRMLLP